MVEVIIEEEREISIKSEKQANPSTSFTRVQTFSVINNGLQVITKSNVTAFTPPSGTPFLERPRDSFNVEFFGEMAKRHITIKDGNDLGFTLSIDGNGLYQGNRDSVMRIYKFLMKHFHSVIDNKVIDNKEKNRANRAAAGSATASQMAAGGGGSQRKRKTRKYN